MKKEEKQTELEKAILDDFQMVEKSDSPSSNDSFVFVSMNSGVDFTLINIHTVTFVITIRSTLKKTEFEVHWKYCYLIVSPENYSKSLQNETSKFFERMNNKINEDFFSPEILAKTHTKTKE